MSRVPRRPASSSSRALAGRRSRQVGIDIERVEIEPGNDRQRHAKVATTPAVPFRSSSSRRHRDLELVGPLEAILPRRLNLVSLSGGTPARSTLSQASVSRSFGPTRLDSPLTCGRAASPEMVEIRLQRHVARQQCRKPRHGDHAVADFELERHVLDRRFVVEHLGHGHRRRDRDVGRDREGGGRDRARLGCRGRCRCIDGHGSRLGELGHPFVDVDLRHHEPGVEHDRRRERERQVAGAAVLTQRDLVIARRQRVRRLLDDALEGEFAGEQRRPDGGVPAPRR